MNHRDTKGAEKTTIGTAVLCSADGVNSAAVQKSVSPLRPLHLGGSFRSLHLHRWLRRPRRPLRECRPHRQWPPPWCVAVRAFLPLRFARGEGRVRCWLGCSTPPSETVESCWLPHRNHLPAPVFATSRAAPHCGPGPAAGTMSRASKFCAGSSAVGTTSIIITVRSPTAGKCMTIRSGHLGCWRLDHESSQTIRPPETTPYSGWPRASPLRPRGPQNRPCPWHTGLYLARRQGGG